MVACGGHGDCPVAHGGETAGEGWLGAGAEEGQTMRSDSLA